MLILFLSVCLKRGRENWEEGVKKDRDMGEWEMGIEANDIGQKFGNIIPLQGDVTSKESLASIAKRVEEEVGFVNRELFTLRRPFLNISSNQMGILVI